MEKPTFCSDYHFPMFGWCLVICSIDQTTKQNSHCEEELSSVDDRLIVWWPNELRKLNWIKSLTLTEGCYKWYCQMIPSTGCYHPFCRWHHKAAASHHQLNLCGRHPLSPPANQGPVVVRFFLIGFRLHHSHLGPVTACATLVQVVESVPTLADHQRAAVDKFQAAIAVTAHPFIP